MPQPSEKAFVQRTVQARQFMIWKRSSKIQRLDLKWCVVDAALTSYAWLLTRPEAETFNRIPAKNAPSSAVAVSGRTLATY